MTSEVIHLDDRSHGLSLIIELFPEEGDRLGRLFRENSSFQSRCEDYQDCLAALQQWRLSTSDEASAMRDAYEELRQQLEQEAQHYLEGLAPGLR